MKKATTLKIWNVVHVKECSDGYHPLVRFGASPPSESGAVPQRGVHTAMLVSACRDKDSVHSSKKNTQCALKRFG